MPWPRAASPAPQPGIQFPVVLRDDITTLPAKPTADTLYRRAGLGPSDIDVAQFYDCFTITVLLQLEDYGFCAKGEGGAFASSGAIELGGSLPINTGGGHLSEGYIHGMNHIVEGVRQIRGDVARRRCRAPRRASSRTRRSRPASALILRRDVMSDAALRPPSATTATPAGSSRRRAAASSSVRACSDCGAFLHMPRAVLPDVRELGGRSGRRCAGPARCTPGPWSSIRSTRRTRCRTRSCSSTSTTAPGVRLVGDLPGSPDLQPGMPMRVRFDELADGVVLPQWEPA